MSTDYNALVVASRTEHRVFSFDDARALLPMVKEITAEAVHQAGRIATRLQRLAETDPERAPLNEALRDVIRRWTTRLHALGVEVKGLWLVDFDNGEGYYCWSYPEESLTHYHGYDDGFGGRMKIV